MKYTEALEKAITVCSLKGYICAGSFALIHQEAIPARDIHDLDFVTNILVENPLDIEKVIRNEHSTCYRINNKALGFKYDVFVLIEKPKANFIHGLWVQDRYEIMLHKREFAEINAKHYKDL